jgi:NitT/TauT family transport system permease protein
LLAWAERFKLQQTSDEREYTSWFYDFLRKRRWFQNLTDLLSELLEKLDGFFVKKFPPSEERSSKLNFLGNLLFYLFAVFVLYEGIKAVILMVKLPSEEWFAIAEGLLFTTLRVFIAILLSLLWTVPLGVLIGRNPRLRKWLQPLVQIVASVPATALFPVFLLLFLHLPMGLNLASVVLMMAGTQWYILFNVIAGASAIPKELEYTADLLHLSGWEKWKILILPAVFPYVITGTITAAGGAWNASIVAEYITFGGHTYSIPGLGELISIATADGDYKLLFTSTVVMIAAVVLINRIVWRKLYGLAREKYRLE